MSESDKDYEPVNSLRSWLTLINKYWARGQSERGNAWAKIDKFCMCSIVSILYAFQNMLTLWPETTILKEALNRDKEKGAKIEEKR